MGIDVFQSGHGGMCTCARRFQGIGDVVLSPPVNLLKDFDTLRSRR